MPQLSVNALVYYDKLMFLLLFTSGKLFHHPV